MKQTRSFLFILITIGLLVASCGPSAEESATMTAAAWTATPLPTSTPVPTPIPYDLTVKVTDQDGAPIIWATVALPESGDDTPVAADEAGQVAWFNLPGDGGTLNVSAPGYLSAQQPLSLQRGPNEVVVSLESDPSGLMPSQACAPGEKLLYLEDFQDGQAQGWPEIMFGIPGWTVGPAPDESSNTVLSAQYAEGAGEGPLSSRLQEQSFENAAWRLKFLLSDRFSGQSWFSLNWLHALEPFEQNGVEIFDSRYQLPIGPNYIAMRRLQQPVLNIGISQSSRYPKAGEWHYFEIGTYQGKSEVWMDGQKLFTYQDPQPLPPGTIGLELWLLDAKAPTVYFDNISVCELSTDFVPMPTPESQ